MLKVIGVVSLMVFLYFMVYKRSESIERMKHSPKFTSVMLCFYIMSLVGVLWLM